jgi:hypothetical protein
MIDSFCLDFFLIIVLSKLSMNFWKSIIQSFLISIHLKFLINYRKELFYGLSDQFISILLMKTYFLGLAQVKHTRVKDLTCSERQRLNVSCHLLLDADMVRTIYKI